MSVCPFCQGGFRKLNRTVWYKKDMGKMCCEQCVKSTRGVDLVDLAKQMSTVSWYDLEKLRLIKGYKGRIEWGVKMGIKEEAAYHLSIKFYNDMDKIIKLLEQIEKNTKHKTIDYIWGELNGNEKNY